MSVIGNQQEELILKNKEQIIARLAQTKVPDSISNLVQNNCTLTIFKQTPKISSFMYSLVAGAFQTINPKEDFGSKPSTIIIREAMKPYLNAFQDQIFQTLINGIKYFQQFFKAKIPLDKIDFVFLPNLGFKKMSFPGTIFLDESLLRLENPTKFDKLTLTTLILQDICKMWISSQTAIKWWNSLWMIEGLSIFLATLALFQSPDFEAFKSKAWELFNLNVSSSYLEDSVQALGFTVSSSEEAEILYDEITKYKGACIIKQLYNLVGEAIFKAGLQEFLLRLKGKSFEINDLIVYMKKAAEKQKVQIQFDPWLKDWVASKGANTLTIDYQCLNDKITSASIRQISQDGNLKRYDIYLASFDEKWNETKFGPFEVLPQEISKLDILLGIPKPMALIINTNYDSYVKTYIDKASIEALKIQLPKIKNDLLKILIWQSLWGMVVDGVITSNEYLSFVLTAIPAEDNHEILSSVLQHTFETIKHYIPKKYQEQESTKILEMLKEKESVEEFPENKRDLLLYIVKLTANSKQLESLLSSPDLRIPQEIRYEILKSIFGDKSKTLECKKNLLEVEHLKDKSEKYYFAKLTCEANLPDLESKKRLWDSFTSYRNNLEESVLIASMIGFWNEEQLDILEPFIPSFFQQVIYIYFQVNVYRYQLYLAKLQSDMPKLSFIY